MRYAKGSLVINPERDIPLLRQVRNSKFVSHQQLFELMKLGGFDHSRNSFNWRLKRLLNSGNIGICPSVHGAGSAVYRITKDGITLLEHHGQFTAVLHSNTEHLPHLSQVFHSLELNAVQLALARANLLAGWQSEIEIASFNTISRSPYQKDYDAIVDVWIGDRKVRAIGHGNAVENLKGCCSHVGEIEDIQYARGKIAFAGDEQVAAAGPAPNAGARKNRTMFAEFQRVVIGAGLARILDHFSRPARGQKINRNRAASGRAQCAGSGHGPHGRPS